MARTIAIGEQDFSKIIEYNCFYIDKTDFIKEWWENRDTITLITRPRRFGKTLTMSMLCHFFSMDQTDGGSLFQNLKIWKEKKYQELQGTYPVVFLSFANVKGNSYTVVRKKICQLIVNLYAEYGFLLKNGSLEGEDTAFFKRITVDMDDADAALSLYQLSGYLYSYYNKKVLILLDEYDTPMQEAYVNGYWDKLAGFIRGFMNSTFKTNPYLERAIMTGVTRISKESIFSDLNNLTVVTTTTRLYETAFGFTQEEVFQALEEFGKEDEKEEVRRWYDGFRFGSSDNIYNPWSIINFLKFQEFGAYWANTSSNQLVGSLIQKGSFEIKRGMEDLMNGKMFHTTMDEQIVFNQLDYDENAIWSLLLAGGYLKAVDSKINRRGKKEYVLDIVNFEVRRMFEDMFAGWFAGCSTVYNDFIKALLANDTDSMNAYMNQIALHMFSYFDSGRKLSEKTEPERFFHGFVLGLIVDLADQYVITSNRESGLGRYDVLLEPCSSTDDGIILEFKVVDPDREMDLSAAAQSAISQILDKKYAAALEAKGMDKNRIRLYGFAFEGKKVLIKGGYLEEYCSD